MEGFKHSLLLRFSVVLLILLGSCREAGESQRIVHPLSNRILGIGESHEFVSPSHDSEDMEDALAVAQGLQSSTKILTLGVLEGERHEMFGQISDIKVDRSGNMYVLDSGYSEVRVFNSKGSFLHAVGKAGRGPGEFFEPRGLEIDSAGHLIAVDKDHRITIFEWTDDSHEVVRTLTVPFEPIGLCLGENTFYIHGFTEKFSDTIFPYSFNGDRMEPFGAGYESQSALVYRYLSEGQVACSQQQGGQIIYSPRLIPAIYSYSLEGDIRWVAKISDFKTLDIIEDKSGESVVSMNVFANAHDQVARVIPFSEKYMLVQIASITPESLAPGWKGERREALLSYLMLSKTGEAVLVGSSLPSVYALTGDRMYTAHSYPYPQVSVYRHGTAGEEIAQLH